MADTRTPTSIGTLYSQINNTATNHPHVDIARFNGEHINKLKNDLVDELGIDPDQLLQNPDKSISLRYSRKKNGKAFKGPAVVITNVIDDDSQYDGSRILILTKADIQIRLLFNIDDQNEVILSPLCSSYRNQDIEHLNEWIRSFNNGICAIKTNFDNVAFETGAPFPKEELAGLIAGKDLWE